MNGVRTSVLTIAAGATAALGQPCDWEHVPTPATGVYANVFDIDGSGPDDVWAVGEYWTGSLPWDFWNFAMRFDGERWISVPVPNLDALGDHNELSGVVSVSPTEAYAAGDTKWFGAQEVAIFRWDGVAWTLEARNIIDDIGYVNDMGRAGADIWTVGGRTVPLAPPAAVGHSLSLRRTPTGWVEQPVPPLAALGARSTNELQAIDGIAEDNAWAVGVAHQTAMPLAPDFGPTIYAVHWDGARWTLDTTLPMMETSLFNDVVMTGPDEVWAVGWYPDADANQPLIMRRDSSGWTKVDLPRYPSGALLRAVAARAPDDIYAFGLEQTAGGGHVALILHYDGSSWTQMAPAVTDGSKEQFMAATVLPGGEVWGLGIYVSDGGPLTERLTCGECRADLNGDGSLDFFDFLEFQDLFAAGDPRADFDGSGALDFFDFLAFQNEFAAGCE